MTYLGEPRTLGRCLAAIRNQTVQPDEVIQVQGRRTESRDIEQGFRQSRGERIYTTNADCYLPPTFIESIDRWLDSGLMLASGVRLERQLARRIPHEPKHKMRPRLGVIGSGMGFNRAILRRVLPLRFDTGWDTEIAMRARTRFVIDPSIRVYHDDAYTAARFMRKTVAYSTRTVRMLMAFGGSGVL